MYRKYTKKTSDIMKLQTVLATLVFSLLMSVTLLIAWESTPVTILKDENSGVNDVGNKD